jgi:hypothetical protein
MAEKNTPTLIDNIDCSRLAMDKNGFVDVSDDEEHPVRRWKQRTNNCCERKRTRNQLNGPTLIVIDEKQSIDVAGYGNQRIWKFDLMVSEGGDALLADASDNSLLSLRTPIEPTEEKQQVD